MNRIALENNTVISNQPPDTICLGEVRAEVRQTIDTNIIMRNYRIHWKSDWARQYYLVSCILEDLDPRLHWSGGEPVQSAAVRVSV